MFELAFLTCLPDRTRPLIAHLSALTPETLEAGKIVGLWEIDVGLLNTVVILRRSVRPMPDCIDRSAIAVIKAYRLEPAPFSPTLDRLEGYRLYELRRYRYRPEALPDTLARWSIGIDRRTELSPLVAFGYRIERRFVDIFHIWAYHDAEHRNATRNQARALGFWPPGAVAGLVSQQNCFARALPNSCFQ